MGDREETFTLGNHTTSIRVGNMTYETELGAWQARALQNKLKLDSFGVEASALVGNVKLTATAGALQMKGQVSARLEATGPITVKSGSVVVIQSPGNGSDIGPVLTAGSREPFTNLPFGTWGIGAKTVVVRN
jgi:hypothetical protein